MKIIIPMSGFGERFRRAGYKVPKPLILVDNKPIIAHVIEMFGIDNYFIFICNKEHLVKTNMYQILNKYAPNNRIIEIDPHKKGPVYAVTKAYDLIDDDEKVIVNYCDFCCYWNFSNFVKWVDENKSDGAIPSYKHFKNWVISNNLDGCIPSYRGFHPHSLGSTNYAYLKLKEDQVIEVKEKEPFTNNRMDEFASSGTYYFKKGWMIKKYFNQLIKNNIEINGEFYCSLVYNLMIKNNLKISVYELEFFMQWGTPEDLQEYINWSDAFKELLKDRKKSLLKKGTLLLPMAGKGKRFLDEGFKQKKPLIEIEKKPMFIRSINSMPKSEDKIVITCDEDKIVKKIKKELKISYPNSNYEVYNLKKLSIKGFVFTL